MTARFISVADAARLMFMSPDSVRRRCDRRDHRCPLRPNLARPPRPAGGPAMTFPEPNSEGHFCKRCEIHRTRSADGLCPSCLDDDKKEASAR